MCVKGKTLLGPLKQGNRYVYCPGPHDAVQHAKCYTVLSDLRRVGVPPTVCYSGCSCNVLIAVVNRAMAVPTFKGEIVEPTKKGLALFRRTLRKLRKRVLAQNGGRKIRTLSWDQLLAKYVARSKRLRIINGQKQFELMGYQSRDATLSVFVKFEAYPYGEYVYENREFKYVDTPKDPRAIWSATDIYFALSAKLYKLVEKQIYKTTGWHHGRGYFPSTCMSAKSMNLNTRGETVLSYCSKYANPMVISLDISRFERSCVVGVTRPIHEFVNSLVDFEDDDEKALALILTKHQDNRKFRSVVRGDDGKPALKGTINSCLPSGSVKTSLVAYLVMVVMLSSFVAGRFIYDLLSDGDDTLIIMDSAHFALLDNIEEFCRSLGFILKLETVAYDYHDVEWCQCMIIAVDGKFRFVRNYRRAIFKAFLGLKLFDNDKARLDYVFTKGHCELLLHAGIPVLQSMALCMVRNAHGGKIKRIDESHPLFYYTRDLDFKMLGKVQSNALAISSETRTEFALTFDCPVEEQYRLETHYNSLTMDLIVKQEYMSPNDAEFLDLLGLDFAGVWGVSA